MKRVVAPSAMASARALCGAGIELIELAVDDSGPTFITHPQHALHARYPKASQATVPYTTATTRSWPGRSGLAPR